MLTLLRNPFLPLASLLTSAASAQITEFSVPTPGSRPYTIVAGPDGNLWFTESNGNKIAKITPAGVITEYPVPTAASGPYGIAVGRDGHIWFTERFGNKIGRFSIETQQFAEFDIPTPFAQPWEIALAADGNLWFTEDDSHLLGRLRPDLGLIQEFAPPTCCFPLGIAAGADGKIWFTMEIGNEIGRVELTGAMTMFPITSVQTLPWDITAAVGGGMWFTELAGRALGRITFDGVIAEDPVPGSFSGIAGVCAGPEGNRWFTENDTDHVGSMDAAGNIVQLLDTSPGARPLSICLGPDGKLWFTEADANRIGRVDLASPGKVHVLSMDAAFAPRVRTVRLGQRVQWTFLGPNLHSVVDASGLGLFDSTPRRFVSYYELPALAAGTYVYRDGQGITPDAAITVLVELPSAGTAGVPFRVTWARVRPPAGLVYDVQVREPGSAAFVDWTSGTNRSGNYTGLVPGRYSFRARLRSTISGTATLHSAPVSILLP